MLTQLKRLVRCRPFVTGHARLLLNQVFDRGRNAREGFSDQDHLRAAANWLAAAQDSQKDGGIAGRYQLDRGWTSSYPETTGYIVPTLLALNDILPETGFRARAGRAVRFLLSVQLPDGSFPGLEIADNRNAPSAFNTGQILHGLTAWLRATGDRDVRVAAERAARWLVALQDPDGAIRLHAYEDIVATYTAHLTCWLAEWGYYADDDAARAAASRHLDWVLGHRRANDWIALMGFDVAQHRADEAFTHTIAYAIWGILTTSVILGRADGIAAATAAAERLARRLELSGFLPGVIGSDWRGRSTFACVTGNCQMALIWLRLHSLSRNLRFVNAALKAIDLAKITQPMHGQNPGLVGGIPGSDPISGAYIEGALPSWAAKFFIDALLEKRRTLAELGKEKTQSRSPVVETRGPLCPGAPSAPNRPLTTVLLTTSGSRKVPQMLGTWRNLDLGKLIVVIEHPTEETSTRRLGQRLQNDGFSWLGTRLRRMRGNGLVELDETGVPTLPDVLTYCRANQIDILDTGPLDGAEAVTAVRGLAPDLGIHAGASLLRQPLIEAFRLGILNAHMGLLPTFRGMNAAEWATLEGAPVGCTVHLIDRGIDTGPILATREVDAAGCRSIADLRRAVDRTQIELLGEVVGQTIAHGTPPQPLPVTDLPGPQYFRMHQALADTLDARLLARQ
jgi:hypothetical protein